MPPPRPTFYQRLTSSVPLLVTVAIHVLLIAVAGFFFVSEQIIGKKKTFDGAPPADTSVVQKQVKHRLQVARKGGGSANTTPVSASRIFSSDASALQLPAMPELPSMGATSLAGMGFGRGTGGVGTGTGFGTGIGNGGGLGAGFMSLSFLGTTSQKASKIVFIVDVGTTLMDIRKGGFEAFGIIRAEIMKLISRLPPNAEFGLIVYEADTWGHGGKLRTFNPSLLPATLANKNRLLQWIKPINQSDDTTRIGIKTIPESAAWKPKALPTAGIDPDLEPPIWADAVQCALEMAPDTIYIVAGSAGNLQRKINQSELSKRKRANDELLSEMKKEGLTPDSVKAAREAAQANALSQLDAINAKLKAQGKSPLIIERSRPQRILEADFQAALRRDGHNINFDTQGWKTKSGKLLWWKGYNDMENAPYSDLLTHLSKLQRVLVRERAALNIFLLVGPNEEPKTAIENLSKTASRNGGVFQLLTTKRIKELQAREAQAK